MNAAHSRSGLIRIVIAEQNRTYAESLSRACSDIIPHSQLEVHCLAGKLLEDLHEHPADIVLLGLIFEDMDAVEILRQINQQGLARHTMIISGRWEEHILLALRKARFNGAIDTTSEPIETVQQALRGMLEGNFYISTTLRPYLIDELPDADGMRELTEGEIRVLRVIGNGSDNQEAAELLGLSEATVQTHRRNIMRKLKVSTSAKLVHEAVRLGIVRIVPATTLHRPHRMIFPKPPGAVVS